MVDTECNANGVNGGGTANPGSVKKTALRDVQNQNAVSTRKHQDNLHPAGGKSCGETVKVCGNKRLTPECPSSSQGLPYSASNDLNENVMNARRRFDLELGIGRLQSNVEKKSSIYSEAKSTQKPMKDGCLHQGQVATPSKPKAIMAVSSCGPTVTSSLGKDNRSTPVAKISQEVHHAIDLKSTDDLLRVENERFTRLQKFLKQCDEASQRDYTHTLMHLSASELSKHAVELEKRADHLTIDEGNEMQRLKALNISIKPSYEAAENKDVSVVLINKCLKRQGRKNRLLAKDVNSKWSQFTEAQTQMLDDLTAKVQRISTPTSSDIDEILRRTLEAQRIDLNTQFQQILQTQVDTFSDKMATALDQVLRAVE